MTTVEATDPGAEWLDISLSEGAERGLGEAFEGVLGAYRQEGFEAGYARAINDLRADFVLIAEQFLRQQSEGRPELRQALRAFEQHIEREARRVRPVPHGFVDGGLGI